MDPTQRFSDRADLYARYRPSYPPAAVDCLVTLCPAPARVADVGSGTGILTHLLLDRGFEVLAVEPNPEMRALAERDLGARAGFTSVAGTAERTGVASGSVDLVVAAQAFHWFDREACRGEFARLLRPGGQVALIWNRRTTDDGFAAAYERFVERFGRDYQVASHRTIDDGALDRFFAPASRGGARFDNPQALTFEALRGRLLSASYMALPGEPGYDAAQRALRTLFERYRRDDRVVVPYVTRVDWGRVG